MDRRIIFLLALALPCFIAFTAGRVLFVLLALDLGASPLLVGAIPSLMQLPLALLSIPLALLAARIGTRGMLVAGGLLGLCGVLLAWLVPSTPALLAGALGIGLWNVLVYQPTQNLVGVLSTPQTLARNLSAYAFCSQLSLLAGPLAAGFATDWLGRGALIILLPVALAYVALTPFAGRVLGEAAGAPPRDGHADHASQSPLQGALAHRATRLLILVSCVAPMSAEVFQLLLPLYGHAAGLPASVIGAAISTSAAGGLLMPLVLTPLIARLGEARLLGGCILVVSAAFMLLPFSSGVALFAIALAFGMATSGANPITAMVAYSRLPAGHGAQYLGVRNSASGIGRSGGASLFGALASLAGLPAAFAAGALLSSAAGVWITRGSWLGKEGNAGDATSGRTS